MGRDGACQCIPRRPPSPVERLEPRLYLGRSIPTQRAIRPLFGHSYAVLPTRRAKCRMTAVVCPDLSPKRTFVGRMARPAGLVLVLPIQIEVRNSSTCSRTTPGRSSHGQWPTPERDHEACLGHQLGDTYALDDRDRRALAVEDKRGHIDSLQATSEGPLSEVSAALAAVERDAAIAQGHMPVPRQDHVIKDGHVQQPARRDCLSRQMQVIR